MNNRIDTAAWLNRWGIKFRDCMEVSPTPEVLEVLRNWITYPGEGILIGEQNGACEASQVAEWICTWLTANGRVRNFVLVKSGLELLAPQTLFRKEEDGEIFDSKLESCSFLWLREVAAGTMRPDQSAVLASLFLHCLQINLPVIVTTSVDIATLTSWVSPIIIRHFQHHFRIIEV